MLRRVRAPSRESCSGVCVRLLESPAQACACAFLRVMLRRVRAPSGSDCDPGGAHGAAARHDAARGVAASWHQCRAAVHLTSSGARPRPDTQRNHHIPVQVGNECVCVYIYVYIYIYIYMAALLHLCRTLNLCYLCLRHVNSTLLWLRVNLIAHALDK
jgi:hypothetical protein